MATPTRIELGRVARAQGMDGTLLVQLHGDDASNLSRASEVTLEGDPGSIPFRVLGVESVRPRDDGRLRVRLQLAGVDSRERAESWVGAGVTIPEDTLEPLAEGEYYWRDLMGLRCVSRGGEELGPLREIWTTPSHDVLVIGEGDKPILFAVTDALLVSVDREAGVLVLEPPEGYDEARDEEPS
jgi:16S rRNA processing protein RimM